MRAACGAAMANNRLRLEFARLIATIAKKFAERWWASRTWTSRCRFGRALAEAPDSPGSGGDEIHGDGSAYAMPDVKHPVLGHASQGARRGSGAEVCTDRNASSMPPRPGC